MYYYQTKSWQDSSFLLNNINITNIFGGTNNSQDGKNARKINNCNYNKKRIFQKTVPNLEKFRETQKTCISLSYHCLNNKK